MLVAEVFGKARSGKIIGCIRAQPNKSGMRGSPVQDHVNQFVHCWQPPGHQMYTHIIFPRSHKRDLVNSGASVTAQGQLYKSTSKSTEKQGGRSPVISGGIDTRTRS